MDVKILLRQIRWNGTVQLHRNRHCNRITAMLDAVSERYALRHPQQLRQKHCRWLIEVWFDLKAFSPSTRTDYRRSLQLMIQALGREQWLPALRLAHDPKMGGRPRVIKASKSKRRGYASS